MKHSVWFLSSYLHLCLFFSLFYGSFFISFSFWCCTYVFSVFFLYNRFFSYHLPLFCSFFKKIFFCHYLALACLKFFHLSLSFFPLFLLPLFLTYSYFSFSMSLVFPSFLTHSHFYRFFLFSDLHPKKLTWRFPANWARKRSNTLKRHNWIDSLK